MGPICASWEGTLNGQLPLPWLGMDYRCCWLLVQPEVVEALWVEKQCQGGTCCLVPESPIVCCTRHQLICLIPQRHLSAGREGLHKQRLCRPLGVCWRQSFGLLLRYRLKLSSNTLSVITISFSWTIASSGWSASSGWCMCPYTVHRSNLAPEWSHFSKWFASLFIEHAGFWVLTLTILMNSKHPRRKRSCDLSRTGEGWRGNEGEKAGDVRT